MAFEIYLIEIKYNKQGEKMFFRRKLLHYRWQPKFIGFNMCTGFIFVIFFITVNVSFHPRIRRKSSKKSILDKCAFQDIFPHNQ